MQTKAKVMITGVSGVGKTTLAKELSRTLSIPFVSGSYSDLVPKTANMPHKDMISQSKEDIAQQDWQVINGRHKSITNLDSFITDRSYIDSMAYWLSKLSGQVPACETDLFIKACSELIERDGDKFIFIPFTLPMMTEWDIEDNHKRITSRWYQYQLTSIISGVLSYLNYLILGGTNEYSIGTISYTIHGFAYSKKILILYTQDFNERVNIATRFINGEL